MLVLNHFLNYHSQSSSHCNKITVLILCNSRVPSLQEACKKKTKSWYFLKNVHVMYNTKIVQILSPCDHNILNSPLGHATECKTMKNMIDIGPTCCGKHVTAI